MSTPTADRTPKRTTAHPAKDFWGHFFVDRHGRLWWHGDGPFIHIVGERASFLVPPDDYARHWELEGPR